MRKLTLPPHVVVVRPQLHKADCGIAAIAMALGLPYEDVFRLAPQVGRNGMMPRRFHAIGKSLGVRFRPDRYASIDEDTGLLWIKFKGSAHLAYVHHGTLVNPSDGTLWLPSDYLHAYDGKGLLYRIAAL